MTFLRATAAALVVGLLFVPALTRATQRLDAGPCTAAPCGFHKSGDLPPDPSVVLPDPGVILVGLVAVPSAIDRPTSPDETLSAAPDLTDGDALRAPPVSPLS